MEVEMHIIDYVMLIVDIEVFVLFYIASVA